jgi:hypothetical protein
MSNNLFKNMEALGYGEYRVFTGQRRHIIGLGTAGEQEVSRLVWRKWDDMSDNRDRGESERPVYGPNGFAIQY